MSFKLFYISFNLLTSYRTYVVNKVLMDYYKKFLIFIDSNDYDGVLRYLRDILYPSYTQRYKPFYYFSIFYVIINIFLKWYVMTKGFSFELGDRQKFQLYLTTTNLVFWQIIYFNILALYFFIIKLFYLSFKKRHYDFVKKNIIRDEDYVRRLLNNIDITFIAILVLFLGCISCFNFVNIFIKVNALINHENTVLIW